MTTRGKVENAERFELQSVCEVFEDGTENVLTWSSTFLAVFVSREEKKGIFVVQNTLNSNKLVLTGDKSVETNLVTIKRNENT